MVSAGLLGCSKGPRPSIIIVTVDTLRADHLGAYGHEAARTPVIDDFARRGRVFTTALTPSPRTTPALATLLTGLRPWTHGSREVGQKMRAVSGLASTLKQAGYFTLAVSVNGAAGPEQNLDLGFDRFLDHLQVENHTAAGVTDATLDLLDEAEPTAPLLLWVHYIDPHFPYAPPASWTDQPAAPVCRSLYRRIDGDLRETALLRGDLEGRASAGLEECTTLYDAEIAFTDFHLGRLFEGLETRGWLAGSFVLFTSDHGENLGEDGLFFEHGPSVHDASLRVPLILVGPGVEPARDRGIARLEDITPTLLDLEELDPPEGVSFDGVSLVPRLGAAGSEASATIAIAEAGNAFLPESFAYIYSGQNRKLHCINAASYSLCSDGDGEVRLYDHEVDPYLQSDLSSELPEVVEDLLAARDRWPPLKVRERAAHIGRYKLVERPRFEGGFSAALYDLSSAAGESEDMSARFPELVKRLRRELSQELDRTESSEPGELSSRTLEALRALGYVY